MEKQKKMYRNALLALFLATVFWGSAGVVMKMLLTKFTPYNLLAYRFFLAAFFLILVFHKRLRQMTKRTFLIGGLMGIVLYLEFLVFTIGLQYTTASKSTFIIGAYVILVPFAYIIINRRLPKKSSFFGAFLCLVGVMFVLFSDFNTINKGDFITFFSAAAYAVHVVLTAKVVKKEDPIVLNILQISVAAAFAVVVALLLQETPKNLVVGDISGIFYLAIVATIFPYLLSVFGQKYVKTTTAAIILSFESVVGCVTAVLILHEAFTWRMGIGAVLIVGSLLITEVKWSSFLRSGKIRGLN